MSESAHPNTVRVQQALAAAGSAAQVRRLAESTRTAVEAAAALGVGVGQIANSLVFAADGEPVLVLTSGAHRADVGRLAEVLGAAKIERATPELVRTATGFPIGGVAPVGHPAPLRTLVDTALAAYPVVWAAGGTPDTVFSTTFDELLRLTGGRPAEVD
ncbi:MAG TPA: YbaK/EbsC family protein [Mycobacteriales bacterium]|nr:YbaK/EbsC family protein [Mycobacteriales bacterium]